MTRGVLAVFAALSMLLAACGADQDDEPAAADEYKLAYLGVCAAARLARAGNPDEARRVFLDRSHQPLHVLAAATQAESRATAGRLLESKQAVEAELQKPTASLGAAFDQLRRRVSDAVKLVTNTRPGACPA